MTESEEVSSDFQFSAGFTVNDKVRHAFDTNGYIFLRGVLDNEEVNKLRSALESDEGIMTQTYSRDDGAGRRAKVVLWNHPGNDITGVISRSEKIAGTFEKLLGGEVYHYHAKVIRKEAKTGGMHVWHQDYGYWYENGCLTPDMGTVWIAVDKADKGNGCVQLLKGSHKAGRINHTKIGDQAGADPERLEFVKQRYPLVYAEVEPGDAFFFQSNVLHCSAQNNSDRRRWGFLVAYNKADNNPVFKHHHPQYTPLHMLPNSAIKECTTLTDMRGKDFFQGPKEDFSLHKIDETSTEKSK